MSQANAVKFGSAPFQIVDGDRGKNYPKQNEFSDAGFCLFLNASNVTRNGFDFSQPQFITEQKDNALGKGKLHRDDVVLTTRGTIGNSAFYSMAVPFEHVRINSGMVILRCDTNKILPSYLYHFLRSPSFHGQVNSLRSGVAQPQLPIRDMRNIELPLPSLQTQQHIASILSAYDDLIENNRRRIQLLEQAARLLYKEWFVHLRFPGHEHVKITDGVPEGWGQSTIADVCAAFEDGDWIESKDQGGEDFRLLQVSNIGDNEFVETGNFRYITSDTFRNLRCNEVVPGDILISRMPKPIGRAWYVTEQPWRMITAVDVTIARPNPEIVDPYYYLYHLNSPTHIARCELRATGATRPRVSRKNMGALPILIPTKSIQATFGKTALTINQQRENLTRQNKELAKARDLLLPRLMTGEVAL